MKYLLDTNVYVALLRNPVDLTRYRPQLARILPQTYLSSVVLHELLAGARGERGRNGVHRAVQTLERAGRVVTPDRQDWVHAGVVRGRLWESYPELRPKDLQNDILIATSARQIGAAVVTNNHGDFAMIARYVHVPFATLETLAE